jgi:hypothetical protein
MMWTYTKSLRRAGCSCVLSSGYSIMQSAGKHHREQLGEFQFRLQTL